MEKTISNVADLAQVLKEAKNGGQFAYIYAETKVSRINQFPTDGSEKVRIDSSFQPTHVFSVQYNFGTDYEKAMSKALGEAYEKGKDENRETIVKNLLMRYKSTNNVCLIYLPNHYNDGGLMLNGRPMTEEEKAYMERYKSKAKPTQSLVDYRTIGIGNVRKMVVGKTTYIINCPTKAQNIQKRGE